MRIMAWMTVAIVVMAACSVSDQSDCEQARMTIVNTEMAVCNSPGYGDSKFCLRCVAAQYYATTGASVCQCAHLTFDATSCSYAAGGDGSDAMAQVRSAIDWADSVCADFTPPAAIPPVAEAGANEAMADAPSEGGSSD